MHIPDACCLLDILLFALHSRSQMHGLDAVLDLTECWLVLLSWIGSSEMHVCVERLTTIWARNLLDSYYKGPQAG